ncbi:hypothetical protein RI129_006964 [Pyrocoelia pectoralis]|uniref:Uncharacterized protein n=1 Tax=Pyrocoelia pectoralis TaxID=417401 RepID=A0AAN7VBG5_9COLE
MFRLLHLVPLLISVNYVACAPSSDLYVGAGGGAASHGNLGASAGISIGASASLGGGGGVGVRKHEVISERVIDVEGPPEPELKGTKTVVERTYIPQYAEKKVRVPTYVEKTIRVPSYVEKTVKVPIEPKVIEKEVSHEHVEVPAVKVTKNLGYEGHYAGGGVGIGAHGHGHGGGFFDGIFNIPIKTLGAVNGFLNGLAGGGGGGGFHAGAGYAAF